MFVVYSSFQSYNLVPYTSLELASDVEDVCMCAWCSVLT